MENKYKINYRAEHKNRGLCTECLQKALQNHSLCEYHLQSLKIRSARYRRNKALRNECRWCTNKIVPGRVLCKACAVVSSKMSKNQRVLRLAEKRCLSCGKPLNIDCDSDRRCFNCSCHLYKQKRRKP